MSSTFSEDQAMINENQFDTAALSGTWLYDNKHLLDHVNIPGCKFVYKKMRTKMWWWSRNISKRRT